VLEPSGKESPRKKKPLSQHPKYRKRRRLTNPYGKTRRIFERAGDPATP